MKLYWSSTSPFVRKVQVLALETGLGDKIETVPVVTTPIEPSAVLFERNPLAKIPALELDDGRVIYDSRVICEYLDGLHNQRPMMPKEGDERLRVQVLQALADGVLDAGILVRYEQYFRPADKQYAGWIDGQLKKVNSGLDALNRQAHTWSDEINLGQIAVGCTLGWLLFRGVVTDIRQGREPLFSWYERFVQRPSMVATEPKA